MLARLEEALRSKGITAKVIYSGGEDVDVLAAGASKGKGLEFLLQQVCLSRASTSRDTAYPLRPRILSKPPSKTPSQRHQRCWLCAPP